MQEKTRDEHSINTLKNRQLSMLRVEMGHTIDVVHNISISPDNRDTLKLGESR